MCLTRSAKDSSILRTSRKEWAPLCPNKFKLTKMKFIRSTWCQIKSNLRSTEQGCKMCALLSATLLKFLDLIRIKWNLHPRLASELNLHIRTHLIATSSLLSLLDSFLKLKGAASGLTKRWTRRYSSNKTNVTNFAQFSTWRSSRNRSAQRISARAQTS